MTEDQAREFRRRLIEEVYPELNERDGYLADRSIEYLAQNLQVSETMLLQQLDMLGPDRRFTRGMPNVVRGTSRAAPFFQDRVWEGLQGIAGMRPQLPQEIRSAIFQSRGSAELCDYLFFTQVAAPTGRIRGGVTFTNAKNTPFQALAADGAKLALWRLFRAGFDVWGFIHDEFVINLPAGSTDADAELAVQIMEEAMSEVLVTIPAECEWVVADHWAKP